MKLLRCAACVLLIAFVQVRAQQDVDEEVDDFKPTLDDDMILYTQKFAFKLGFRDISGAKSGFSGSGHINSRSSIGDATGVVARTYHDGAVYLDGRYSTDPAGRTQPISPDGKSNQWTYFSESQAAINGLMMMHTYSAAITDFERTKNPSGSFGVDLSIEREMGKLFGDKIKWGVIGGVSINGLSVTAGSTLPITLTTVTDYYSLFGQAAPTAPHTSSDSVGTVDSTVLIGNEPLARTTTITTKDAAVTNVARLKGAYMTFRAGPTLFIPITEKFSGTIAAGLALAYTGTTYEMTQTYIPDTGDQLVQTIRDGASNLLPGFFVDANVQYSFTDTAGLYLGAVYQNTGSFDQTIEDADTDSKYTTHVDLSKLQGIRAGVSFRF